MLKKTRSGTDEKVKVTFVVRPPAEADHVHVVGDFNDWQAATPMKKDKEGRWRATLALEPGREYEFRYLVDGNYWVNDEAADRYVPNPFGADNCVLTTPEVASETATGAGGRSQKATTGSARTATGTKSGTRKPAAKRGGSAQDGDGSTNGSKGGTAPGRPPRTRGE